MTVSAELCDDGKARSAVIFPSNRSVLRMTSGPWVRTSLRRLVHRTVVYHEVMSKRLSLILGEGDQATIEPFIRVGTEHHNALRRWAEAHGAGGVNSEAATLRVLLRAGAIALQDDVLDAGYAELAQVFSGEEERAERRTARDRYTARTDAAL